MALHDEQTDEGLKTEPLVMPRLEGPDFLAGTLEATAWTSAARAEIAVKDDADASADRTEAYAFHDGKYLYVAWKCWDSDIAEMRLKRKTFRDHFCEGDHVWVWLDVALEHEKGNIWELGVDPYGSFYRHQGGIRCWPYMGYYGVESAARIFHAEGYWTAALRVLLSEVGIDLSQSNLVGFNVGRMLRGKYMSRWVEPDGEVDTGWGFAFLDTDDEALTRRSAERISLLRKRARQQESLPDVPGRYKISNSQVGVCLFGPPHRPTLWVGKSDVWDRRIIAPDYRQITLAELKEAAFSESEWSDPAYGFKARHHFGMCSDLHLTTPQLAKLQERTIWYGAYVYPCPKPVGQVIIGLPFEERACRADVSGELAFQEELPNHTFSKGHHLLKVRQGDKSIELRIFLRPRANVIMIEGRAENMDGEEILLRVYRHRDVLRAGPAFNAQYHEGYNYMKDYPENSPIQGPEATSDEEMILVCQDFPAEQTFPDGFRAVLMGGVRGAEILRSDAENMKVGLGTRLPRKPPVYADTWLDLFNNAAGSAATLRIRLAGPFRAAFAVATTGDGPDPHAAARALVHDALEAAPDALWKDYQEAPRCDYVDTSPYGSDIPVGSSCGPAKFCLDDMMPWHGAFTFDENISRYPKFFILGAEGDLEGFYGLVERMLPLGRRYAREVFECAGAAFPITHYPIRMERFMQSTPDWDFSMELTAELMKPFWMHYLYTQDAAFLSERAYPILKAGAEFYADFLTLEEDGWYHVVPTTSPEHWGMTRNFILNKDSLSALTMARYHLNATARAAEVLGVDPDRTGQWRGIALRMAPYPMADSRRGRVFVDAAGAPYIPGQYNEGSVLAPVIWGDDIGLDSSPELVDIARRTAEDYLEGALATIKGPRWASYGLQALFRLGVSYGEAIRTVQQLSPSGAGDSLEEAALVPLGLGVERFLQSHTGVLRVFPAVDRDYTGRFEDYRAEGAFSVSAEMENGRITRLEIRSLAGKPCRLARPWTGEVRVREAVTQKEVPAQATDQQVVFETQPGTTYNVTSGT